MTCARIARALTRTRDLPVVSQSSGRRRKRNKMKILGQDDWLVFARRDDGVLVYTTIETTGHWLDAPHKGGDCWSESTGLNCCGETMSSCRIDNSWMQAYVTQHPEEFDWRECDNDTDGTYMGWGPEDDEEFMLNARKTYLCD